MTLAQLTLVCAVALLGPLLFLQRYLRMPVVIGELLVGVVLGETGLRVLNSHDPTFTFLGDDIGFALVMYVAGSHVPIRSEGLRAGLRSGLLRAVAIGALSVPAGLAVAAAFGTGHGLLYAVLIASSSASIVMPALAGIPLTAPPIVAMMAQIAVADAACIVLLPLAVDPAQAPSRALGAATLLSAAYLVYLFLRWVERSGRRRAVHEVSEERGLALELRTSLTILFALSAVAQAVQVSVMLAGFSAGLAVAAVGEPRRLTKQLFALTEGFFAPLFFVWLGASLDLRAVAAQPSLILLGVTLGLVAAAIHGVLAFTRQPLPVALVTCAQLGVPVAAATLGDAQGLLAPGEDAALLVGALVTILVTTFVSSRVEKVARDGAAPVESSPGGGGQPPGPPGAAPTPTQG
ncbi:MAG: cation:proton antiporter [Dermatophilaceae bacterium]